MLLGNNPFYIFKLYLFYFTFLILFCFTFFSSTSFNFERDIARILKEQELVTKRMKEFEEGFASPTPASEAKVGFAAIQEMARLQNHQSDPEDQNSSGNCDLSFLRFDPQSKRMTLESGEKTSKFPLEIPASPIQSPNLSQNLKKMGSWR